MARDYDHFVKALLVGMPAVGKTNIMTCFADSEFMESYIPTVGVDFRLRVYERTKIQVWDSPYVVPTTTAQRFYYSSCHAILVVYDVTSRETFDAVQTIVANLPEIASGAKLFLVANKADLQYRQVTTKEGQNMAAKLFANYAEVSTKTGQGVEELFANVVAACINITAALREHVEAATEYTGLVGIKPKQTLASRFCPKLFGRPRRM